MKRLTSLIAASLVLAIGLTAQASDYYFDVNGSTAESGVADQSIYAWERPRRSGIRMPTAQVLRAAITTAIRK